ncbi:hypothetical protein AVEN_220875-1 [Araneus ventricosus]|uniref:Uncharacterized protein n=1 Tax=Araneus ventricosus TaxID=182803 RepID=A0A4Y2DAA3_ARAVE|nr:hypothetical protein AVEN_220875-1 [Araneus ventricosus]
MERSFGVRVTTQVTSDRGSKLRGLSQNSPSVASKRDVNIAKLNLVIFVLFLEIMASQGKSTKYILVKTYILSPPSPKLLLSLYRKPSKSVTCTEMPESEGNKKIVNCFLKYHKWCGVSTMD